MNELEELQSLHNELSFVVSKTRFAQKKFDDFIGKFLVSGRVTEIREKLQSLKDVEYVEYMRVRTLPHINETMWENYELFQVTGLPEQILLAKAASAFVDRLSKIHKEERAIYVEYQEKCGSKRGRKGKGHHKGTEREQVQSEDTRTVESSARCG